MRREWRTSSRCNKARAFACRIRDWGPLRIIIYVIKRLIFNYLFKTWKSTWNINTNRSITNYPRALFSKRKSLRIMLLFWQYSEIYIIIVQFYGVASINDNTPSSLSLKWLWFLLPIGLPFMHGNRILREFEQSLILVYWVGVCL